LAKLGAERLTRLDQLGSLVARGALPPAAGDVTWAIHRRKQLSEIPRSLAITLTGLACSFANSTA
jgi:hypothetical protein